MFMTAGRLKIDGKPLLKLNIHEFGKEDVAVLKALGIAQSDEDSPHILYKKIYSQDEFLSTRASLLTKYKVLEEKGPRVFLTVL